MRKVITGAIAGVMALNFLALPAFAVDNTDNDAITEEVYSDDTIVLEGEVGEIIEVDGIVFQRLEDDAELPDTSWSLPIVPFSSSKPWDSMYGNALSGYNALRYFDLNSIERYWKIWIQNTSSSSSIVCTIDYTADHQCVVPAGQTWNFYSTNQWAVERHYASFTGNPLQGNTAIRIASTYTELWD